MSLINQMLQELDARRAEPGGAGPFGEQVRAVPERRGIHPAWWVALALAGALTGVVAWAFLRPPPPAPAQAVRLPLKLDAELDALPPAMAQEPTAHRATGEVGVAAPAPVEAAGPKEQEPSVQVVPREVPGASQQPESRAPAARPGAAREPVKPAPSNVVPDVAKVVPPARKLADAPIARPSDIAAALAHKQFKELTAQQRSENEYRKAIIALEQGKMVDAIAGLEQALQIDAHHAAARQALIGALLENNRQDDALKRAREGLALDPAQSGLAMIAARLQLEKAELRPAIETLERSLPSGAERADYQAFLAALLQRDEQHKKAVEHYVLALQKAPQNGIWWMGLGISLQAERRVTEAQEAFRRAKASNSLTPELQAFVEGRLIQLQH